ncbi:MAG: phosphate signaling complex PhoU family protein, partial [Bilophila wadsworthia]
VLNHDLPRAAAVLDGDTDIDDLENQIDEATLNILARTQPVARDLRFLMSVVRMVLDLERIGDESVVVAEQVTLSDKPIPSIVEKDLRALCTRTSAMLRNSLLAFQNGNFGALAVSRYDDETAQMMVNIFQKLMQAVGDTPLNRGTPCTVLITRALDRVCRRAENIAEHAYFMVEGVSLKHRRTLPQAWEK